MASPAVQTFGKYQILDRIATGGMAEIYKARLEGIGGFQRTFAIKRILPNLSQNAEYIAMLVDEAKVAGLLSHANIVQILDLGQVDGIWYIAMEYVHGRDLGAVLRRANDKGLCLPVPHCVFVAIELLKGLEYAHQRQVMRGGRPVALNIIHRDISPPNILLSLSGEVKLTDFGIARASLKVLETVSGIVKGRFDYMSPEQAAGRKDLDQRSDLFSVGVVLYEMLTGHHPFRTANEIGTIEKVRTGEYIPVSQRNPEVPFTLESIVDRALQVDREDRFVSATAFKEALDTFFHEAGFIFTHATLASYVKGLFPEQDPRAKTRGPPTSDVSATIPRSPSTDSLQLDDDEDDDDGPTRRLDRPPDISPLSSARPIAPRAGDHEPTAIRTNPLTDLLSDDSLLSQPDPVSAWDDQGATAIRPQVWEDDEQATVIRKSPLDLLPKPQATQESKALPDEEVSIALINEPERIFTNPEPPQQPQGSSAVGWLGGLLMTTVAGFGGLTVGAILTILFGLAAGFRLSSSGPASIRVLAPADTKATINKFSAKTGLQLPPGTHEITIEPPKGEPYVVSVELEEGQQRIILVTPAN